MAENQLAGQSDGQRARPTVIVTADATTVLTWHNDDGDRTPHGVGVPQVDLTGVSLLDLTDTVGLRFGDRHPDSDGLAPIGQLLWGSHAGPITLSEAELERLSCEADVTLVLKDGRRIVGTLSDDRYATPAQRRMLTARDLHCRFPGCAAPAVICVAHHVVPWPEGPTDLPNLALLCPVHHHVVHHRGWTMTIDDDDICTFRRGRRTYTTYPADLRRLQPRDGPDP